MRFSLNIKGRIIELEKPAVMGIINLTPDSFFEYSRKQNLDDAISAVARMTQAGADIIDIGACSTRPGGIPCSEEDEFNRLKEIVPLIREKFPEIVISIDTFRSNIAKEAVTEWKADIINDVSGGEADEKMFDIVAELKVPYILTHPGFEPRHSVNTQEDTVAARNSYITDILKFFLKRVSELHLKGVADVIVDPGFGFGKTHSQNFTILSNLDILTRELHMPVLVGVSRKRIIHETLGCPPSEALNGTTVLNTVALMKGASVLRVHDVKEASETVKLVDQIFKSAL